MIKRLTAQKKEQDCNVIFSLVFKYATKKEDFFNII